MLGKIEELNGKKVCIKGKIVKAQRVRSKRGVELIVGEVVDRDGWAKFTLPIAYGSVEEGKCYKLYGVIKNRIFYVDNIEPIEQIPNEQLFQIPTNAYILEVDNLDKIYIVNYCPNCHSKVVENLTRKGVIYNCPKCNYTNIPPEELVTKIFISGRIHDGAETKPFFLPHKILTHIPEFSNIIKELDEKGESHIKHKIVDYFDSQSFIIEGFVRKSKNGEEEFLIRSVKKLY